MPELPEVETVRRGLERMIIGRQITAMRLPYPKVITGGTPDAFIAAAIGATFTAIDRRGKYLLLRLSNQRTIVSHLRMEGQYSVEPTADDPRKHTEIIFDLDDDRSLFYNDTRRFGRMVMTMTAAEADSVPALAKLGPEPTAETLTRDYMVACFGKSRKVIKAFLLDQNQIAGLGNIYADEVLWQTQIHPETPANQITAEQIATLRDNIIAEIALAIQNHGTTVHSFSNIFGEVGTFQNQLEAYGRKGKPCLRCGTLMAKIRVAQRGTTYCPICQVAPNASN